MKPRLFGFSLLELLVAMAITTILVALAYPTYRYHVLRANRRAAEVELMEIASRLEDFHNQNETYRGSTLAKLKIKKEAHDYYFQLSHLTDESYLIKATPEGKQRADLCGILWIDETGHCGGCKDSCNFSLTSV